MGAEPPADGPLPEAIVARGAAEIERRGWTDCIVVGDDFGSVFATLVAAAQRPRVSGLAIGHACLEYRLDVDFRAFIRQDVGIWDSRGDYSAESADELVKAMVSRVPREFAPEAHG